VSFRDRSFTPNDRLSYWGGPMAHRFDPGEVAAALLAAERWGLLDPCPADILETLYGAMWMEEHPGLASLVTSIAIGAETSKGGDDG